MSRRAANIFRAACILATALASALSLWLCHDDRKDAFEAAPGNGIAATVNGRPILQLDLESTLAFGKQTGAPAQSATELLESRIDDELLYQEGERLSLVAIEAEVDQAVAANRADAERAGPSAKAVIEQFAGRYGLSWESYWSSQLLRTFWRRTITIGRTRMKIEDARPAELTPEQAVEQRLAELRAKATIERFDP